MLDVGVDWLVVAVGGVGISLVGRYVAVKLVGFRWLIGCYNKGGCASLAGRYIGGYWKSLGWLALQQKS